MFVTLTAIEIAYVLALAVVIMLEKRSPLSTLAWIFGLALLPVVGLVVWYLLGPLRLRRKRSKRASAQRRIRASLGALPYLAASARGALQTRGAPVERQLMALALNSAEAPLTPGNDVRILRNGGETYGAMEADIRAARHHVHLQSYIFADDEVGRRFRALLLERARSGVQVRLLTDAVGSWRLTGAFLAPLVEAGVEIGFFNPVSFARFRPALNFRNHRKIVVCDGATGYVGGLNVAREYAGLDPAVGLWRDTHARLRGPAVQGLQLLFLEDWNFATGRSVTAPEFFAAEEPAGDALVQIVGSGPDRDWSPAQQIFFSSITSARDRVRLTTPYFVPDESVLTALATAALRGVDVDVLVPRRGDSRVVGAAGRSYYDELLRAGVRIHEYLPGMLHAKTLVVDDRFAIVGSANVDCRSFSLNYEVFAMLYGPVPAGRLSGMFEEDLRLSREVTVESRTGLPLRQRLAESSARLLSPLL